jgi:hypothetical protein
MGFNFGAALGAAAKSGTETYAMLEEQKRKEAEMVRQNEVHAAWKKEQAGKEALRTAAAEMPTGNTVPVQQFGTGSGGVDEDRPMVQQPISQSEKLAQFQQRALALGADPMAVQQHVASSFQLNKLKREDDVNEQYVALKATHDKKFADLHTGMQDTFAKDGAAGVIKTYGDQYKQITGNTIKLMGNDAIITDSKGKPVGAPIPVSQLPMAAEEALKSHYTQDFTDTLVRKNLFADAKDAINFQIKQAELKNQTTTAQAAATQAGASVTHANAAVTQAEAAMKNAGTAAASAKFKNDYYKVLTEKMGRTEAQIFTEKTEALAGMYLKADPKMSAADATIKAANQLLHSADAKAEVVTNSDVENYIKNYSGKWEVKSGGRTRKMNAEEIHAEARRVLTEQAKRGSAIPSASNNPLDAAMSKVGKGGNPDPFATSTASED